MERVTQEGSTVGWDKTRRIRRYLASCFRALFGLGRVQHAMIPLGRVQIRIDRST